MSDSINRIVPPNIAPERYSVVRRQRDDSGGKKQQSSNGFSGSAPASTEADHTLADRDDEHKQPKAKGKILDISA